MQKEYKIVVVGLGYVGLSCAALLAQKNQVIGVDISADKVKLINDEIAPFDDKELSDFLRNKNLNLTATTDFAHAIINADFIIIATPTNYDKDTNYFDTSSVETLIKKASEIASSASIVVRSTIPVGYIREIRQKFNVKSLFFTPEFLREGSALIDSLYPTRIVIGENSKQAQLFCKLILDCAIKQDIDVLFTDPDEAEAIKLFANSYLAMRVAFFNELDSYALARAMDSKQIINGVCLDPRIGNHYNNPSFGYGGYCLPKDTKQLLANYHSIPQNIIQSIVAANTTRKEFLVDHILKSRPRVVGIYRLVMKHESDNYRFSAVQGLVKRLNAKGIEILIYEPQITSTDYFGCEICKEVEDMFERSDIVLANRQDELTLKFRDKVFSRDLFGNG